MLFVIYRMFSTRKIAKNGITCSKNNENSNLPEIVTKNSITIGCSLFKVSYYLLFVVRYLVIFAIRYLVINAQIM